MARLFGLPNARKHTGAFPQLTLPTLRFVKRAVSVGKFPALSAVLLQNLAESSCWYVFDYS